MKKILFPVFMLCSVTCFAQNEQQTAPDTSKKKLKRYKPDISGVLQVHYLEEFNTNGDTIKDPGGFRILRARLTAKGKINKFISYEVMVDPRAPEQGGVLRDAFIAFDITKNQTLRVGQQKTQFGYENRQSITELFVVNRAEMSDALGRGLNLRDIGLGLLGNFKLGKNFRLENAATFTNGSRMNVAGPWEFSNTKNGWGRLGMRYKKDNFIFRMGFSAGMGGILDLNDLTDPADDTFTHFRRLGTDVQLDHKWFFMAGEYAMGTDVMADTLAGEPFGYYVLIAGKTKWKTGPLARIDAFEDEYQRITAGAYYGLPKDKFRILINYEFRGNIKDVPRGHDDRLYIQMQVVF
jgi:hypothetical protein